jgi:RNA polymerase sigma-70 factor (ECF subfamily)
VAIVDDAELVAAAQGGDRDAFEELVRRTYTNTFTLARRLTGDVEDARDVTQDVYLRAWRGIGKFRGEAQFSTWLYRITANTANTHLRKQRRHRAQPLDEFNDPVETRSESQPAAAVEAADLLERVSAAIDELPEKLRQVVVLRDVYDLSHESIGEELGITVTAAKVRLHRARRKLHDVVYDTGSPAVKSLNEEGNAHAV